MTISIKPTASGSTIEQDGSQVLSIESDRSVDIDSGTLHVDATNNNVGIGTTTPSTGYGGTISNVKLALKGAGAGGNNGTSTLLIGGDNNHYSYLSAEHTGGGYTYLAFGTANGATNPTERMRIDSSGNLLVGKTGTGFSTNGIELRADNELWVTRDGSIPVSLNRKTSTGELTRFHYNGTKVGDISTNGTGTTYNSSSDYRLKENIQLMTGALDKVAQLKPVTYTWKADGSNGQGFIAHELQEVVPDCVTGEKDAVNEDGSINPQGIDTSKLVATLTAAIQEQQDIIKALEARVATLEGN